MVAVQGKKLVFPNLQSYDMISKSFHVTNGLSSQIEMAFLASYINLLIKNDNSINCTEIYQILCYARQIQVLNGFLSQRSSLLESCYSKTVGIH